MMNFSMVYVYGFLTLFLSVDAGLMMLANMTHKGVKGPYTENQILRERSGSIHVTHY
jgi:hypothetical protein